MKEILKVIAAKSLTFMALTFIAANTASAETMSAMDIVKKANHAFLYQGIDAKSKVDMSIIDGQGRERTRQLTIVRKNLDQDDGKQKYYVYFSKPADIKKMVFMAWKNLNTDDDRWLYLPALDLVKRIAASDDRTSFVGSHFFYEDVSGRSITEDIHQLVEETDDYYRVKSIPKAPRAVEFTYYKTRIDKKTFLPMKTEYFNEQEIVYRTFSALNIEMIQGYATITVAQMADNISGGKTILKSSEVKYDVGIPEKIFSERYLRRAPKKYLR